MHKEERGAARCALARSSTGRAPGNSPRRRLFAAHPVQLPIDGPQAPHTHGPPNATEAAGRPADILPLELGGLDRDGLMPVDPRELLFTRANQAHLVEVVVAGRTVARDGRPLAVDLDAVHAELRAAYRTALAHGNDALTAWPALAPHLAAFYRDQLGCGCP